MSLEYIQGVQEQVTRSEVLKQLLRALAGEFNAVHNLGMQARIIEGYQKEVISKQLLKMHKIEQEHVQLLAGRIMEMGGNPDIRPMNWDKMAACDYHPIVHTDQKDILEDVYNGKRCKTEFYGKLLQFLQPRDKTTYDMITRIVEQEYEGLQSIKELQDKLMSAAERDVTELENFNGTIEREGEMNG